MKKKKIDLKKREDIKKKLLLSTSLILTTLIPKTVKGNLAFSPNGNVDYKGKELDSRYVNITGDTMIGTNSTTFFQVQQADTTPVFNVDTVNGRVGIGTDSPSNPLDVVGKISNTVTSFGNIEMTRTGVATGTYTIGVSPTNGITIYDAVAGASRLIINSTGRVNVLETFLVGDTSIFDDNVTINGVLKNTNKNFPVGSFIRTTTNTNSKVATNALIADSNNDMDDGFGPFFVFRINDDATPDTTIADFGAVRDGADNSGKLQFGTYLSGVYGSTFSIDSSGQVLIDGKTDTIQSIIQAHSTQTENIQEIQLSDGTVTGGFDERGILFSDGGIDNESVFIGSNAGNIGHTDAIRNVGIGFETLQSLTTGDKNVAIGYRAGKSLSSGGTENIFIGSEAGRDVTSGDRNMFLGSLVGRQSNASNAVGIGRGAGEFIGTQSVHIGSNAGFYSSGARNILLGYTSGFNQTTNTDLLIVDNQVRTDVATELTNSILYGVMGATPADQTLRINAKLGINTTPTAYLHLPASTATIPALKLEEGTALTTPQAGVIEYVDGRFCITNVATCRAIDRTNDILLETVTVENTTTETTIWTGAMPANSLKAGNMFKFHAEGVVENKGPSASDQVTIRIKVGGVTKVTLEPVTKTLASGTHWHLDANACQRTIGASGSRAMHVHLQIGDDDEASMIGVATIDTTANMDVTVTVEWASADSNNILKLYQAWMEYKN